MYREYVFDILGSFQSCISWKDSHRILVAYFCIQNETLSGSKEASSHKYFLWALINTK